MFQQGLHGVDYQDQVVDVLADLQVDLLGDKTGTIDLLRLGLVKVKLLY
jgi:hypothetical protein